MSKRVIEGLNRDELKALRKELKELQERIERATLCHTITEDPAVYALQSELCDHLGRAANLTHAFWTMAPVDDDPNKI